MIRKYAEIFCWKNVSSFCSAKATHIFSAKNIRILYIESAKSVNETTLNELVKLMTLWTTGPRSLQYQCTPVWWKFTDVYPLSSGKKIRTDGHTTDEWIDTGQGCPSWNHNPPPATPYSVARYKKEKKKKKNKNKLQLDCKCLKIRYLFIWHVHNSFYSFLMSSSWYFYWTTWELMTTYQDPSQLQCSYLHGKLPGLIITVNVLNFQTVISNSTMINRKKSLWEVTNFAKGRN